MSSPKRSLFDNAGVPQPPGYITGTVNDAVNLPKSDRYHGSYHWGFERLVTIGITPFVVWPFVTGYLPPVADATLGALLIAHCHMGLGCCITDYIPKRRFPKFNPACSYMLGGGSLVALYGLYKMETEDEGLVASAKKLWHA